MLQNWTDFKQNVTSVIILYRIMQPVLVGTFKFLLPFSTAFKKWKKWLEMFYEIACTFQFVYQYV